MTMKKQKLSTTAIETLKRADNLTKPVVISETKNRINIALICKATETVEKVLSFSLGTGVCRIYTCESHVVFAHQAKLYDDLAFELQQLSKGAE